MQNSMVVFTFSVSEWRCSFWANLVQKVKIISLSWNLVPTPIRACRIQWWYSLFLFLIGNTLVRQICSKKDKIISWSWNLVPTLIRICRIQWQCSLFLFFNQKCSFRANLVQNVKIVSLRLNLVASIGILKSHTHQQEYHQPSVDGRC